MMNSILGVGDHLQVLKVLEGTGTVLRTSMSRTYIHVHIYYLLHMAY